MGKISTSPRYVINITRTDPLAFGGVGEGVLILKIRKNEVFLTFEGVIGSY